MYLSAIDLGDGPPALLLHGQPGSAGDWSPVTTLLRERMRVVVPDRPGYGHTGGRAVGFRDNATAAIELLDRLGIEAAVLVGHSWATGVALAAATQSPRRVRALVLAAPVSPGIAAGALDRALAHPLFGPPAARIGLGVAGLGLTFPPLRRLASATVPALSRNQVEATAAQWRAGHAWRSFYAEQRALVAELPSLRPHLGAVTQSTTILYGVRDRVAPPAHARGLARLLPNAHLIAVERASHMLPQQRPDLVADAIAHAIASVQCPES